MRKGSRIGEGGVGRAALRGAGWVMVAAIGCSAPPQRPEAQSDSKAAQVRSSPDAQVPKVSEEPAGIIDALNRLRTAAGMTPFRHNPVLDRAAANHAQYLLRNNANGHDEIAGRPGFTGQWPHDRTQAAGYPSGSIAENLSNGAKNSADSLTGLMAAIYHRFGFLHFGLDEAGVGQVTLHEGQRAYVYDLGDGEHAIAEFCRQPPPHTLFSGSGSYYDLCPQHLKVRPEAFQALREAVPRANPRVVVWPPKGSNDTPVVFSGEWPNPLVDRASSGYPVSVQFNPAYVKQAGLVSFKLFQHRGALTGERPDPARLVEITPTRVLTGPTDPNHRFSPLDFALFPLRPLEDGSTYVAQARFEVDGKPEAISWHYSTLTPTAHFLVKGTGETLRLRPGATYRIYVPPKEGTTGIGRIQWTVPAGVQPKVEFEDQNTLRATLNGPAGQSMQIEISGGRKFRLVIDRSAPAP